MLPPKRFHICSLFCFAILPIASFLLTESVVGWEFSESSINRAVSESSNYQLPSQTSFEIEKGKLLSSLRSVEGFVNSQPGWREFVLWQDTFEIGKGTVFPEDTFDRITRRWFHSSQALDNSQFLDVYRQLKRVHVIQNQLSQQESIESRNERLQELVALVRLYQMSPVAENRLQLLTMIRECEKQGIAPELCDSLQRSLVYPNLILRTSASRIQSASQSINETFPTSGVYGGLPTSGSGTIQASLSPQLSNATNAIELLLNLRGSVTSRSVGENSDVRVQSSANSNITASKSVRISGWGSISVGATSVSCPTTISYDSISPKVRPRFRDQVNQRVNANRRSSEIQAQGETESWVRQRMDSLVSQNTFADVSNSVLQIRDKLFNLPDTLTSIQNESSLGSLSFVITSTSPSFPGADKPAQLPAITGNQSISIHESLMGISMSQRFHGKSVAIASLASQLRSIGITQVSVDSTKTEIATDFVQFAKDRPLSTQVSNRTITLRAFFDELSFDGQSLKNFRIEIPYEPVIIDGTLFLKSTSKPKALPSNNNSEASKLSSRQLATCKAIDRRMEREFQEELIELPLSEFLGGSSKPGSSKSTYIQNVSLTDGWIHLMK